MNLENKLATLRKQLGLSQEDLADKLNISRQAVCKWESGQSTPDIDNLKILSQIFNVSVDNLLNNNEDIVYLNQVKLKYGKVTSYAKPSSDSADRDYRPSTEAAKKLKIRSIAIYGSLVAAILFAILAVVMLFSLSYGGFVAFVILTPAAFIAYKVLDKFLFANVPINGYFSEQCKLQEAILKKKNYTAIRLQNDLLEWFYFDETKRNFGFYFDGKEQLICPISNFISFNHISEKEKQVAVGKKLGFGAVVGGINGVGVNVKDKEATASPYNYNFVLKYCDENGRMQDYTYNLTCVREYSSKFAKAEEEMIGHWNDISDYTKQAFEEIKIKLEFEKSRT